VAVRVADEGTTDVAIATLKLGIFLRFDGEDVEHAQALSCRLDDCPPILVERSTATVIDGAHRVLAARLLGRSTIPVRYFVGTREEAFVEAVKANVAHGKPLTLAEREAAATKLLSMHPDWSNRMVAHICGISDKTVGRMRKSSAEVPQSPVRIGRDGRHRPVDAQLLRNEIATALRRRPHAKAEEVARAIGTSPSTVRDVRKRLQRGDDPVRPVAPRRPPTYLGTEDRRKTVAVEEWRSDRAILSLPQGSSLAEWLDQTKIQSRQWEPHVSDIPLGRLPQLIADAKTRAAEWNNFAEALEQRFKQLNRRSS
jgi:ParB-like chromosome segregation protein Spo0J